MTISSALIAGGIILSGVLTLSVLALTHARVANLRYVHLPFFHGHPFEPALLGLIFGVVFTAYSHFSVTSSARSVLPRDPSGRSLIWGCIVAQASVMILYILWVVAVNGAFASPNLAKFTGTALTPLAQLGGPVVNIIGVLLVIFIMGIGFIYSALGLFSMVRVWLPGRSRYILTLERRQSKLIFIPRGRARGSLALTYLGLKGGQPQFRVDFQWKENTRRFEVEVQKPGWEARTSLAECAPNPPSHAFHLFIKVVTASADMISVQVITNMRMRYEGRWDTLGFDFLQMAETPEAADAAFINWLVGRGQVSVEDVARFLSQTELASRSLLDRLVKQGALVETRLRDQVLYHVHFAARRRRQATATIWQALDDADGEAARRGAARSTRKHMRWKWMKELVRGEAARFWLALSPLFLTFLVTK